MVERVKIVMRDCQLPSIATNKSSPQGINTDRTGVPDATLPSWVFRLINK
jgi:hypothetical protein